MRINFHIPEGLELSLKLAIASILAKPIALLSGSAMLIEATKDLWQIGVGFIAFMLLIGLVNLLVLFTPLAVSWVRGRVVSTSRRTTSRGPSDASARRF